MKANDMYMEALKYGKALDQCVQFKTSVVVLVETGVRNGNINIMQISDFAVLQN